MVTSHGPLTRDDILECVRELRQQATALTIRATWIEHRMNDLESALVSMDAAMEAGRD